MGGTWWNGRVKKVPFVCSPRINGETCLQATSISKKESSGVGGE